MKERVNADSSLVQITISNCAACVVLDCIHILIFAVFFTLYETKMIDVLCKDPDQPGNMPSLTSLHCALEE